MYYKAASNFRLGIGRLPIVISTLVETRGDSWDSVAGQGIERERKW